MVHKMSCKREKEIWYETIRTGNKEVDLKLDIGTEKQYSVCNV